MRDVCSPKVWYSLVTHLWETESYMSLPEKLCQENVLHLPEWTADPCEKNIRDWLLGGVWNHDSHIWPMPQKFLWGWNGANFGIYLQLGDFRGAAIQNEAMYLKSKMHICSAVGWPMSSQNLVEFSPLNFERYDLQNCPENCLCTGGMVGWIHWAELISWTLFTLDGQPFNWWWRRIQTCSAICLFKDNNVCRKK